MVNALLHTVATGLVVSIATRLSNDPVLALASGLLFASHPIHTEAVAGVVGRADLLATVCFLFCIHSYLTMMDWDAVTDEEHASGGWKSVKRISNVLIFLFWTIGAVLSKEHGLTVLGVCLFYDLTLTSCSSPDSDPLSAVLSPGQRRNRLSFDRGQHSHRNKLGANKQQQNGCSPSVVHLPHSMTRAALDWLATRCRSIKRRVRIPIA